MTTTDSSPLAGTDLGLTALAGVPTTDTPQKARDFTSSSEVDRKSVV